jgi:hypothetical protein
MSAQTDRELLELAARAAGYEIEERHFGAGRYALRLSTDPNWVEWNPLTDDGDAFRLAVKLGIDIAWGSNSVFAAVAVKNMEGAAAEFLDDPYAATRRAVVRAAAAIAEGETR